MPFISFLECGGLFTLPGRISSPNYPNNYEKNSYCEWLLKTEPTHSLKLLFSDFDLESSVNCTLDSVKVIFFLISEIRDP